MIDVHVRWVSPAEMHAAAHAHPESVLICGFDEPSSPAVLAEIASRLSTGHRPVTPADIRSVAYDEVAAPTSTALSLNRLDPHTDGSFLPEPPPRFLLGCRTCDPQGGGATTLIPVEFVIETSPGWVLAALQTARYRFLKSYDGNLADSVVAHVLTRGDDGRARIRWRADEIYIPKAVDPDVARADEAAEWLYATLTTADAYRHVLQPGEIIIVPNLFVVHGRDPLSPDSAREVLRAWVF